MREFLTSYVDPSEVLRSDLLTLKTFMNSARKELGLNTNDPAILAADRIIRFAEQYVSPNHSSYYSLYQQLEEIQAQISNSTSRGMISDTVLKEIFNSLVALLFKWLQFEVQTSNHQNPDINTP